MRIGVKDVKKESKPVMIMGALIGIFVVVLMCMAVKSQNKDVRKDKKETLQEQSARSKY